MDDFLKGKNPLTDKFRIQRNIRIYKSWKDEGKDERAEELKESIQKQIKRYREIYQGVKL